MPLLSCDMVIPRPTSRLLPRAWIVGLVVVLLPECLLTSTTHADYAGIELIADQFGGGTIAVFAPGETDRMFVGSRDGVVRILDLTTNEYLATPFLSIPDVDTEREGALIALAFHPDYETNGRFFVNVTLDNGGIPIEPVEDGVLSPFTSHVFEYTVSPDPNVATPVPSKIIEWIQPRATHNGGWMGFGPNDGYLYINAGDGGNGNDNGTGSTPGTGNAQDITDNLFGKVVRLDVDGPDAYPADLNRNYAIPANNPFVGVTGDDEIWAYGVRNAFRGSFDRATGDYYFGDVGAATREEINFQPGDSLGGENYGWRLREGSEQNPAGGIGGPKPPGNVDPIYDYLHGGLGTDPNFEGNSVTGGYVYRGPDPEIQGEYLFADYISHQFWTFDPNDAYNTIENVTSTMAESGGELATRVTSFAEDAHGNLYFVTILHDVYRILTDAVTPGDFNSDARVDKDDLTAWSIGYGISSGAELSDGDADGNGAVDGQDFLAFQRNFGYDALQVSAFTVVLPTPEPTTSALALSALCLAMSRRQAH